VGPVWIPGKVHRETLHQSCVFHRVGSAGRIVHSVASGTLNINALFFLLEWDEYGFYKMRDGTPYTKLVFLHPMGYAGRVVHVVRPRRETSMHYFSCLGGTGTDSKNSTSRHVTLNLCFVCGGICESRSAFRCVQDAKCRSGRKMPTHYFSYSAGSDMHSTKSAMGDITTNLCFCIWWDSRNSVKGHVTPNLRFCIRWDLRVM
jgi:hypothetical protein